MRQRKWLIPLLLVLALLSIANQVEAAAETMRGDRCEIAEDTVITEDFYFLCRILDVKGTIEGDLIGAAAEITIHRSAHIAGDLWIGGGKLFIEGEIGDDIHFGGLTMQIAAHARFSDPHIDVTSLALNTEIRQDAVLPGNLLVYGYQAKITGTVGGDVDFGGEALLIDGVVSGRIDAEVGDPRRSTDVPIPIYDISFEDPGLWIGEQAHISQDIDYRATTPSMIPLGAVQGTIRFEQTGGKPDITKVGQADDAAKILVSYFRESLVDMITLLILGVIGLRIVPNVIQRPAVHVRQRTVRTAGWGLITFMISIPFVIGVLLLGLLLVLILYLIKLNELTLLLGISVLIITAVMVGIFSFLLFFMGRVVVSFMLGELIERYVLRSEEPDEFRQMALTLGLGGAGYALLVNVPLPAIGLIVELITALVGSGAVVMYLRGQMVAGTLFPARAPVPRPADVLPIPASLPPAKLPPPKEPQMLPPGLDNLPEGFVGFEDDW